jgi:WD40 repeat protein
MLVVMLLARFALGLPAAVQTERDETLPDRRLWPVSGKGELTFPHETPLVDACLASDRLLTLDTEGVVSAWKASTSTLLWRRWVHDRGRFPRRLALSADGRFAALSPRTPPTDVVRLLDAASGKELRAWAYGIAVTFSGDGKTVAAADGAWLRRWDIDTGRELPCLPPAPWALNSVALSGDGRSAAATARGVGGFLFWEPDAKTFSHHARSPDDWELGRAVAFAPDGGRLAVVDKKVLSLWRMRDGRPDSLIAQGSAIRLPFRFLPDGVQWIARSGHRTWTLRGEGTGIEGELPPGHVDLFATSEDGKWILWADGSLLRAVPVESSRPPSDVLWAGWHPDGRALSWRAGQGLELWSLSGGPPTIQPSPPADEVLGMSGSAPRCILRQGKDLLVWDLSTEREVFRIPHEPATSFLGLSPDGDAWLSVTKGRELALWDVHLRSRRLFPPTEAWVLRAAYSADGKVLAWTEGRGALVFADARTGAQNLRFADREFRISALALSDDGSFAATGSESGSVHAWRDRLGVEPVLVGDLGFPVTAVAVSRAGRWIAAGCKNGTLRLFPSPAGQVVACHGFEGAVERLAFSPDGRHLQASGRSSGVLAWRLPGE